MAWEAIALRYATLASTRSHMFLRWESYGDADGPQTLDYYLWVLREGRRTVVVDTGFHPAVGARRGRTMLIAPQDALATIGIRAAEVDTVVLTHLHYDHVGNVELFGAATVLAPGADLDFWTGPLASRPQFAEHIEPAEVAAVAALRRTGRLRRYDGDLELAPGVRIVALPGHSPGQHGLLVQTPERPLLLSSDAVHFYEELEQDRPFAIQVDLAATHVSYDRVRDLVRTEGAALVPGHDPAVMERFPPYPGTSVGVAARLG